MNLQELESIIVRPKRKRKSTHKQALQMIKNLSEDETDDDDATVEIEVSSKEEKEDFVPIASEDDESLEDLASSDDAKPEKESTTEASTDSDVKQQRKKPKRAPPSKVWSFLDGKGSTSKTKKVTKKKATKKTTSTPKKVDTNPRGRRHIKSFYKNGEGYPILSHPQEMFDDMISVQLTEGGTKTEPLVSLLKKMHRRPLRVATMCSGTESPILALDMLSKSIEDFCHEHMDKSNTSFDYLMRFQHVFSCEIEPFKQAYIERNFQPPLLFRDIRELGNEEAYTAYGSLAKVPNTPGCVDLLVAGTSCVDYSNLNNKQVRSLYSLFVWCTRNSFLLLS